MASKNYVMTMSLKFLRSRGEVVEKTEYYVSRPWAPKDGGKPVPGFRKDLFGFADIAGFYYLGKGTRYYQITTASNASARMKKAAGLEVELPATAPGALHSPAVKISLLRLVLFTGNRVFIHGWRKNAKGRWVLKEIEIVLGDKELEMETPESKYRLRGKRGIDDILKPKAKKKDAET